MNIMKFITTPLIVWFLVISCSHEERIQKVKSTFDSFEIGYANGWTKGFSFRADSNGIFFSPNGNDSLRYGILPDSIIQLIDKTLSKVVKDTSIKSKDRNCVDCSDLAMLSIIKGDTIFIRQAGDIDSVFWPVIKTLETFIDSGNYAKIKGNLFLESQKVAFAPPPPPPKSLPTKK